MKRSWSPADSFQLAVSGQIYGHRSGGRSHLGFAGIRQATPARPYEVTRLGAVAPNPGSVQSPTDPAAIDADDQEHPERRRMRAEAVLLVAKTPLSPRKLAQLAHLADATEARTLVRQLNQTYETLGRAIRVEQIAGGFRMMTRPALAPWLARLGHLPQTVRLSTPMMETLAVVAYRQPVSRANAEAVRGVACGELLRQLMERDLVRIVGRSEELGRPYLYGTTTRFLQLFGLPNVNALPPIQWHAFQEDPIDEDFTPEDSSTSTKEPVVSTTIALTQLDAVQDAATLADESESNLAVIEPADAPSAVDDDDEEWDDDDEEEDDDDDEEWDDEEDWDEDDDDDDDEVDDEVDDEFEDEDELDDDDDLEEDDWEEVDDDDDDDDEYEEDDDLEDDEDEDWDEEEDDSAEDDEDWE